MKYSKLFFDRYQEWNREHTSQADRIRHWFWEKLPSLMNPELRFFKNLKRESRILELGCGNGKFLRDLRNLGFSNLTGVDFSPHPDMGDLKFITSDIPSFLRSSPDGSFDFIVLLDVLEHLPKETAIEVVSLIHEKLSPGGRVLIRVPNIMSLTGKYNFFTDLTHVTPFTDATLFHMLAVLKFQNISIHSSEKWIKFLVDPRRWLGLMFFVIQYIWTRAMSVAFGGPKVLTLNVTAIATKP